MSRSVNRVVLLVLDSCGCGGAPDAQRYGDAGADTLGHTAAAVGGLHLPSLARLGLGRIAQLEGVDPVAEPLGAFGRLQEASAGKDTTTGHWELAGLVTSVPFATYPQGFPQALIDELAQQTGRGVLGNKAASGIEILDELGPEQLRTGHWIVYTSVDSVLQLAAHEQLIPLEELYAACRLARRLCDPYRVGRVIARPYVGQPGSFVRTYNRHDFAIPPHGETLLDRLSEAHIPVVGVGKIEDIFAGRGLSESIRSAGNADGMEKTIERLRSLERGLLFVNLVDFDSVYGHRRDPLGFAQALEAFDRALPALLGLIGVEDLLIISADHGNDPTYAGSDHTREQVPVLAVGPPGAAGVDLGCRQSFGDVAATIAEAFGISARGFGESFLARLQRNR